MFKQLTRLSIVMAAILFAFSGLAQAATQQELAAASVIEVIKKRGSLRVGMATLYPGRCVTRRVT